MINSNTQIQSVLLAGGWGTRLWPLSRQKLPKQFLSIRGNSTFFQETLDRIPRLREQGFDVLDPIVLCLDEYRFFVQEQCRDQGTEPSLIIIENTPKNTLPPLAITALNAIKMDCDPYLLILPIDGYFDDLDVFVQALVKGVDWAGKNRIVTFGVRPETHTQDYGYAQMGQQLETDVFSLDQFQRKSDTTGKKATLEWDKSLWNLGIYLMKPSLFLEELEKIDHESLTALRSASDNAVVNTPLYWPGPPYDTLPARSFERGFLEKTSKAVVVMVSTKWADLGTWKRIHTLSDLDEDNNSLTGDVISIGSSGNIVKSTSRLVATVGLKETAVIETSDAILVSTLDKLELAKGVITELQTNNRNELIEHKRVYRPWGSYESIRQGEGFQVKSLMVHPNAKLSLQAHRHRSEHWTVVRGLAKVTCDDTILTLEPNQSTYIPLGARHRLENPGSEELEVIEVQCGSYLGEDDIIRFEDDFGRIRD
ncbi:MAG: mannose-1-phosphate guanylyltransferase/mannose-6-phosphate isomerase [Rhodobacteraceae bacterium]|nr:mannose-1-phosphate guanylyltransferase/mannose-6-phosphate isomerase [Paracoccaceae bacterium]